MTIKIISNEKGNPPGKLAEAELHFTETVEVLDLLLLGEGQAVVRHLPAALRHAGRIFFLLRRADGAGVFEDHESEAAIDSGLGTGVTTHSSLSF